MFTFVTFPYSPEEFFEDRIEPSTCSVSKKPRNPSVALVKEKGQENQHQGWVTTSQKNEEAHSPNLPLESPYAQAKAFLQHFLENQQTQSFPEASHVQDADKRILQLKAKKKADQDEFQSRLFQKENASKPQQRLWGGRIFGDRTPIQYDEIVEVPPKVHTYDPMSIGIGGGPFPKRTDTGGKNDAIAKGQR